MESVDACKPLTHGQPLRDLNTGGFRLLETRHPRGMRLARHEHERACINFVVDGCYGESFSCGAGEYDPLACVFKPAGEPHENRFERASARCLLIELREPGLVSHEADLVRTAWTRAPAAARLGLLLWREIAACDELSPLSLDEWGIELYELVVGARAPRSVASRRLHAAEELLHDGWREPWTLSRIAREVELHPSHLARAFRARHGRTIGEYLRSLRVHQVARRLALGDEPISALAQEAGFADQSHCTRAFRRQLGRTPAAFRRAFRGAGSGRAQSFPGST